VLSRSDVLRALAGLLKRSVVVAPLGNTVRELYAIMDQPANFYLLGSMGMPIPVGLGLALGQSRTVVTLEGDGGCLMNLGGLASVARYGPTNLKIVILDNGAYESTGHQPSHTSQTTSLCAVASGCGVANTTEVRTPAELATLVDWLSKPGPRVAVVKIGLSENSCPRVPIEPCEIFSRVRRELVTVP
jgi:sulfopyruvate decarboxylase subunit beta